MGAVLNVEVEHFRKGGVYVDAGGEGGAVAGFDSGPVDEHGDVPQQVVDG